MKILQIKTPKVKPKIQRKKRLETPNFPINRRKFSKKKKKFKSLLKKNDSEPANFQMKKLQTGKLMIL